MTQEQKAIVTTMLETGLKDYIYENEIHNVIDAMEKVEFNVNGSVDTKKLQESCVKAISYLSSVSIPLDMIAMDAVYRNQVIVVMTQIENALK